MVVENFLVFHKKKVFDGLYPFKVFFLTFELFEKSHDLLDASDVDNVFDIIFLWFFFCFQYFYHSFVDEIVLMLGHQVVMDLAFEKSRDNAWKKVKINFSIRNLCNWF